MKNLDKIFSENKSSFDTQEVNDQLWGGIESKLNQQAKHKSPPLMFVLKFAVAACLFFGAFYFYEKANSGTKQFQDIALHSPQGILTPLNPTVNKYTLVNFWASGNVLCSEINCYYYLPAYIKYKDQGFEIYAISLDENKEEWIEGIEENELPWIHVSDLQGWDSPVCVECEISKVPTSFLLDQNGEVIARDLNAEDLEKTLAMLFE